MSILEILARLGERLGERLRALLPPRDLHVAAPMRPSRAAAPAAPDRPKPVSASEVFTPTRPRAGRRLLVGRTEELTRILDALLEDSAHVVLYSERGRGKTSLSNLSVERLRRRGAIVARYACEAESTFDSVIRGLARDLPRSLLAMQPDDEEAEGCEGMLPRMPLRPADVGAIPRSLTCPLTIFVVDEFDRVTDLDTRTRLADTIKLLSDRGLPLRFMIVGVSATLEQIIGQHPSIQRAIAGIHLPLLTADEIASMLSKGGEQAGVAFGEEATGMVARVAGGMPYMAQLLGLRITQNVLKRGDGLVGNEDLGVSVERLLGDADPATVSTYATLTGAGSLPEMEEALHSLASAETDAWGRMKVGVSDGQVLVGGSRMTEACWRTLGSSGVAAQPDGEHGMAHVTDRPLIYYVRLLAARASLRDAEKVPAPGQAHARVSALAGAA